MDQELLVEINLIELLLISTMAFFGSFFHRFWQFIYNHYPITIETWMAIFSNMIIVSIITYSLDPLITAVHPRFIILPPLLMGLVGEELINKLIHMHSSLSFIDWFLKYFHIKNQDSEPPNTEPDESLINKEAKYQELLTNMIEIYNKIEEDIEQYNTTQDAKIIMLCYRDMLMNVSLTESRYRQFAYKDDILTRRHNDMLESYKTLLDLKNKIYKDWSK